MPPLYKQHPSYTLAGAWTQPHMRVNLPLRWCRPLQDASHSWIRIGQPLVITLYAGALQTAPRSLDHLTHPTGGHFRTECCSRRTPRSTLPRPWPWAAGWWCSLSIGLDGWRNPVAAGRLLLGWRWRCGCSPAALSREVGGGRREPGQETSSLLAPRSSLLPPPSSLLAPPFGTHHTGWLISEGNRAGRRLGAALPSVRNRRPGLFPDLLPPGLLLRHPRPRRPPRPPRPPR